MQQVRRLLRLRAERSELRRGATEHLHAGEQTYAYRRGATVVAINNGREPAEIRLPVRDLPPDALGVCASARADGDGVRVVIPARSGCVF